jgi:pectinesterase inhibitor-like protein
MKRAAMTIAPVMLVCLATLFVTGDAELTKSRSDVIQLKCSGKPWYELCTEMLKNTPDTAGVTVYALQTATMVKRKYEDTAIAGRHSLQPLSADMPTAYKYCLDRYDIAWVRINAVIDDMKASKFEHTERELDDADTALRNCKKVPNLFQNPQSLMEAVEGDLNATAVAKAIGSLAK